MTDYFTETEDTRSEWKIKHNLQETIRMVVCTAAGGCVGCDQGFSSKSKVVQKRDDPEK